VICFFQAWIALSLRLAQMCSINSGAGLLAEGEVATSILAQP
jgi:hypothetical protein